MRSIAILALICSAHASAAPGNLEVKGFVPGMSFDSWAEKIGEGKYSCKDTPGAPLRITKICTVADSQCNTIGQRNFCHDVPKRDSFAGQSGIFFRYMFHDSTLWQIDVNELYPPSFDDVIAAMQTKYGKTKIVRSEISNKMGAKFEDAAAIWEFDNGKIMYKKYSSQLNLPSSLSFLSADAWKAYEEFSESKQKNAKDDM